MPDRYVVLVHRTCGHIAAGPSRSRRLVEAKHQLDEHALQLIQELEARREQAGAAESGQDGDST